MLNEQSISRKGNIIIQTQRPKTLRPEAAAVGHIWLRDQVWGEKDERNKAESQTMKASKK